MKLDEMKDLPPSDRSTKILHYAAAPFRMTKNMKTEIIPGVLEKTATNVHAKLKQLEGNVAWIQLDVLDQTLVRQTSWHDAKTFKQWNPRLKVELHLMVDDPAKIIHAWKNVPAFQRAVWHIEAPAHHLKIIALCRHLKKEIGLAISPDTPLETIIPLLSKIDRVLVMGVYPGKSGQKLLPQTINTVKKLQALAPRLTIAFDGGVTARNLHELTRAGVNSFCVTSAIFKHPPIQTRLKFLKERL